MLTGRLKTNLNIKLQEVFSDRRQRDLAFFTTTPDHHTKLKRRNAINTGNIIDLAYNE